ncbi:hypothetical protein [Methylorubrum extorquens]|uniref:Uncharacterized protein n=1 Tax=Methylorubrum extorquens TaxID=408 RepID=A0AAX3WKB8_METEX|nr:hypothetical protein [Methylorubrum extorquens]WHQ72053.1 hypothetical protein KEC54_11185 [Methylorubrum extorquens]
MGRVKDAYFHTLTPEQERELYERDVERPGPGEPDPARLAEPELPFPPPPLPLPLDDFDEIPF